MLKKSDKLRGPGRIMRTLKKGAAISSPLFLLKFVRNTKGRNFFAVSVSKKVEPKAVERNHMRRRLMAAIRIHKNLLPKTASFDMLFVVRLPLQKASAKQLNNAVTEIFRRLS